MSCHQVTASTVLAPERTRGFAVRHGQPMPAPRFGSKLRIDKLIRVVKCSRVIAIVSGVVKVMVSFMLTYFSKFTSVFQMLMFLSVHVYGDISVIVCV